MSHTIPSDLRTNLKQELDKLNDSQLRRIADFVQLLKIQAESVPYAVPFWQCTTPAERAVAFRTWIAQLPETHLSLSNEAFNRDSIYE